MDEAIKISKELDKLTTLLWRGLVDGNSFLVAEYASTIVTLTRMYYQAMANTLNEIQVG